MRHLRSCNRHRLLRCILATMSLGAASAVLAQTGFEPFVDIGLTGGKIESRIANRDDTVSVTDTGLHVGFGARRRAGDRSDIGFRLELDSIDSTTLLTIRAFDYRRHISERLAVNMFVGAARLDLATAAYGWYLGAGLQWKNIADDWDLGLDLRFGDKVARDNILPTDPQGGSPDNFHDVTALSLSLSRRFGGAGND